MQWKVEHIVSAPRSEVERVLFDPATTAILPRFMPGIAKASVLSIESRGRDRVVRKRFEPSMKLPAFAKGIDPEMTQWVETVHWSGAAHEATFVIDANVPAEWKKYFASHGRYRLEARGNETLRVIEGELTVRVPLVGSIAERYIVGVLREMFAGEAQALSTCAAAQVAA